MNDIYEFRNEYDWMSNFYTCGVYLPQERNVKCLDTISQEKLYKFPTIEHAYQASKTLIKDEISQFMLQGLTAGQAKRLGRKITLRNDWDDIKLKIMYSLQKQKYSKNKFKKLLINTGDCYIMEGNYWKDTFWGVDLDTMEGENHMGKILMRIRQDIK